MAALDVALAHHRERERLVRSALAEANRLWAQIVASDITGSWTALLPRMLAVLAAAQQAAAGHADGYVTKVLDEQGIDSDSSGSVVVNALSGVASDGRPLASLLDQPRIAALTALKNGADVTRALTVGRTSLGLITSTQVADAGRVADQVALVARPRAQGYVRMLSPPSCSRCAILAGRFYRWSAGFERHEHCDCVHVPASEDTSNDLRTDPEQYFHSLSRSEQDRVFTIAGARAIRDGADISQVVNARRGAFGLTPAGARAIRDGADISQVVNARRGAFGLTPAGARITAEEARALRNGLERGRLRTQRIYGRDIFVTTEGITTRGVAGARLGARKRLGPLDRDRSGKVPRLMPESIYQLAEDREDALRLLRRFGFIL